MKHYTMIRAMSQDSHVKCQNVGTKVSNMYIKSDEKKGTCVLETFDVTSPVNRSIDTYVN